MSGGVDSSAAARILLESGCHVVGATIRFGSSMDPDDRARRRIDDESVENARDICRKLSIRHHVIDAGDRFEYTVIGGFISEYARGRTPNPCIVCNEKIKFPLLAGLADELGLERIATGHFARVVSLRGGRVFLASGADSNKDQSYFLYRVPVRLLRRCIFPLGGMNRDDVVSAAAGLGHGGGWRRGSQDACFVCDGDIKTFLTKRMGRCPGSIVDSDGSVLGTHEGIFSYTIGQRRGLGVSGTDPLYVKSIDAEMNTVVLAGEDEIRTRVVVCGRNKLRARSLGGGLSAKVRYRHGPEEVLRAERNGGYLRVVFKKPQRAVTPGQSLVLYRDGVVMGGGIIERTGET